MLVFWGGELGARGGLSSGSWNASMSRGRGAPELATRCCPCVRTRGIGSGASGAEMCTFSCRVPARRCSRGHVSTRFGSTASNHISFVVLERLSVTRSFVWLARGPIQQPHFLCRTGTIAVRVRCLLAPAQKSSVALRPQSSFRQKNQRRAATTHRGSRSLPSVWPVSVSTQRKSGL